MTKLLDKREVFDRKGSEVVCDVEIYPNYFLICFKYLSDGGRVYFEGTNFNKKMLQWIIQNNTIYTFNGIKFDMPIILFVANRPCSEKDLFDLGQGLIVGSVWWSKFLMENNIPWGDLAPNHVDLIEPSFGTASLKMYGGRMHSKKLQDLPYPFYTVLSEYQKGEVLKYCWNDLDLTEDLKNKLQKDLDLRVHMGKNYGADLRSKSDAQIAEVVISRELKWKYGIDAKRPKLDPTYMFKYQVPKNVKFQTKGLQDALKVITDSEFRLSESNKVVMPQGIAELRLNVHENKVTQYNMGMGGLHSREKSMFYEHDDEYMIIDRDVASFYPRIILNLKLFPKHLTSNFLDIYNTIVERRLAAKAAGDKGTADTLKIVINGSFGKFGSCFSILFSPDLLLATTISGQLYLLMLIERLELAGFNVISGNTDGVVTRLKKDRYDEFNAIIHQWEQDTDFVTEETRYSSYFSRDVNNYIGVMSDGSAKLKGCFGETKLSKNPAGRIIYKAVAEHIIGGVDIDDYIATCTDVRDFLFVRKVEGGAVNQAGEEIGKVIRWYYRKGEFSHFKYKSNGNKVPMTDGGREMMELSLDIPPDIDYSMYSREAKKLVKMWYGKPVQYDLFDFMS